MNKVVPIIILAMSLMLFTGCLTYDEQEEKHNTNKFVYIGAVHSFTGAFATQGVEVEYASELAISHVNAVGGVLGKQLALFKRDTRAIPKICRKQAADLINNEDVKLIFGAIESACTDAILDVTVRRNVLTVTGNPYASELTQRENRNFFFRTSPNNDFLMKSLASKILLDGNHSLTVIAADNMLTSSSADDLVKYFTSLDCGGERCKVNLRFDYPSDLDIESFDFDNAMSKIITANSDVIFFNGYPDDGAAFVRAAVKAGYQGKPYISAEMGHASIGGFLDAKTATTLEWVDVRPSNGISFDYFKEAYETTFGQIVTENRLAERTYDMLIILALAIQNAGTENDPEAISRAVYRVANPPGELVFADELEKAFQLLADGIDIDYAGASGSCDFDSRGDVPVNEVFMGYDAEGNTVVR